MKQVVVSLVVFLIFLLSLNGVSGAQQDTSSFLNKSIEDISIGYSSESAEAPMSTGVNVHIDGCIQQYKPTSDC